MPREQAKDQTEMIEDPKTIITVALDWTQIINTFIATIPLMITSLAGLLLIMKQIGVIHTATNGMKDALVASTAKASLAEGHAAGVVDEQARVKP
jgi:hypothetical protein